MWLACRWGGRGHERPPDFEVKPNLTNIFNFNILTMLLAVENDEIHQFCNWVIMVNGPFDPHLHLHLAWRLLISFGSLWPQWLSFRSSQQPALLLCTWAGCRTAPLLPFHVLQFYLSMNIEKQAGLPVNRLHLCTAEISGHHFTRL